MFRRIGVGRRSRMDADLLTEGDDTIELKGSSIIAAIKASGVEFILSVPDIVTSGGVAVEYRQPICMMIGLLGHDPSTTPRNSPRYGVRIIEPILDAMGIPHHLVNEDADVAKIRPAIEDAYAASHPVALLIGRRPSAS